MGHSTGFDDRVRHEAYRLWEEAGRPHGRDAEFWHQACALVERNDPVPAEAAAPAPKPRKKAAEPGRPAAAPRRRPRGAGSQPVPPSA